MWTMTWPTREQTSGRSWKYGQTCEQWPDPPENKPVDAPESMVKHMNNEKWSLLSVQVQNSKGQIQIVVLFNSKVD